MKFLVILLFVGAVFGINTNRQSCPVNDELFAHESDCTLFYKCSHNVKVVQNCPAGLEWNDNAKICDWPELAGCSSGSVIPTTIEPEEPETTPAPEVTETTPAPEVTEPTSAPEVTETTPAPEDTETTAQPEPSQEPNVCDPSAPAPVCPENRNVRLPHQSDCGKFYICDWGDSDTYERFMMDCPLGLHFSPILEVCDWPETARCACNENN